MEKNDELRKKYEALADSILSSMEIRRVAIIDAGKNIYFDKASGTQTDHTPESVILKLYEQSTKIKPFLDEVGITHAHFEGERFHVFSTVFDDKIVVVTFSVGQYSNTDIIKGHIRHMLSNYKPK